MTPDQLEILYGVFGEAPDYPRCDWEWERSEHYTTLPYWEWVAFKIKEAK